MNKSQIQKFAVNARQELISRVKQRAYLYGVYEDTVEPESASMNGRLLTPSELSERRTLVQQVKEKGFEQVVEEVAYTWFNRFCALRYMEVNNYLPVRVFTDEKGAFHPQIMTEAVNLDMSTVDIEKVYEMVNADQKEALFKYLLICQCNELNKVLPGMFQTIDDYTELLFPDNLLRQDSVIEQMVSMIDKDDWKNTIQIVGWLYQYYNSEPKDKVFAGLKKNIKISKNNIPAATQLFTPDWIVRYMVENSLGRLWLEGHPSTELRSKWAYYLDEAEQTPDVQAQLEEIRAEYRKLEPQDIKVIDPCMGSGHILAYMFDILMQIYLDYGYTKREAVRSILENNLYGLDIDDRAGQLAYFAVMMKARQYDRRFFARGVQPHVYAIQESNHINRRHLDFMGGSMDELSKNNAKNQLTSLLDTLTDAKGYGSILNVETCDWVLLRRFAVDTTHEEEQYTLETTGIEETSKVLLRLISIGETMAQKYDAVVTNPPYMGRGNMSQKLSEIVKRLYPDSKSDLFAVFIEKCNQMLSQYGLQSMITQQSWMFINSYAKLRENILKSTVINMVHLGARAFEEIGGEVVQTTSFVIEKQYIKAYKGVYSRLVDENTQEKKEQMYLSGIQRYIFNQDNFKMIAGEPLAYWLGQNTLENFKYSKSIGDEYFSCYGILTGHDEGFIFSWSEIAFCDVASDCDSVHAFENSHKKYAPLCKGGAFRKWYGNRDLVIRYDKHGLDEMSKYPKYASNGQARYFTKGLTWAEVCMGNLSVRYMPEGNIFSLKGPAMFHKNPDMLYRVIGYLNTNVVAYFIGILNPTISCGNGVLNRLPIKDLECVDVCNVLNNIELSRADWDSFETSWDFQRHPLLNYGVSLYSGLGDGKNAPTSHMKTEKSKTSFKVFEVGAPKAYTIDSAFRLWSKSCDDRFNQLKTNEEELNRIFIDIYGLQDELTPEVEDKDVTVRKADLGRDIRSLISYAVGCMLGRYSLDMDGLAYAGGEWDASKYRTFPADKDNIIPICDDAYFEDDMANRFEKWVEAAFGAATLEENLQFIADALGGRGNAREVIRNYFINDFYADHLKVYQKRPIYWLFDSGKKNGFKALIYMHRYDQDTIARLRTDYVHEQQERYRTVISQTERSLVTAEGSTRVKLNKKLAKVKAQLDEASVFEEKVAHLADQRISIDLDDGVKHNYALFPEILAKIK